MPVERITPQLVKKGKGKKRPGYRGPGGYQGGRGSSGRSRGPSGPPGGGATSMGSGRDFSRGPSSTNREKGIMSRGKGPKGTTGDIRGFKDTGPDRSAVSQFSTYGRNLMNQNLTKDNPVRRRGLGGLGSLIMSGIGALMGLPGLGLITGGFDKLKGGLSDLNETLADFRERTTGYRTQAEYDAARQQRQLQGRLDNLYDRKAKGKSFSQKNIDMLEAMGLQPSTAQNVLTGRDLKGFTESRGLQTPQTFSDPFAMSIGPQAVNVPAREDPVSSYGLQDYGYDYGTAGAAVPTDMLAPTPVENVIQDVYSGAKNIGARGNSFLDSLYNADLINQLGYQAFKNYPSDSATGPLSNARHMAASNELSKSLSPFNNRIGEFIGDTLSYGAGLINEVPALFRGFNKENFDAIKEDLAANYAGTYGTPNTTTAQQIYNQMFDTNKFASTGFAEGGIASLSNRRG